MVFVPETGLRGKLSDCSFKLVDAHPALLNQITGAAGFGNRLLGYFDVQIL
jgi:hypothetical protein